MRETVIGKGLRVPEVIQGCMRIAGMESREVEALIECDLACGIHFFDHADMYGGGRCEELFGEVLARRPELRERMTIQTKCGIRDGFYDFSEEHILKSVEGSLRRLRCERIDILLLHRPDILMEPEEVAAAFDKLSASGKVARFGVSNQNPHQMELLRRTVRQPLEVTQLQFGPAWTAMVDAGVLVNTGFPGAVSRDGGALDYCRLHGISVQAWSPYQFGLIEGAFLKEERYRELAEKLTALGARYGAGAGAATLAWILRHPAISQVVIGTTNFERIRDSARADEVQLSREEWYEIYRAAGNQII